MGDEHMGADSTCANADLPLIWQDHSDALKGGASARVYKSSKDALKCLDEAGNQEQGQRFKAEHVAAMAEARGSSATWLTE